MNDSPVWLLDLSLIMQNTFSNTTDRFISSLLSGCKKIVLLWNDQKDDKIISRHYNYFTDE